MASRYCADPCATPTASLPDNSPTTAAVCDDYMEPVHEGTVTPKYHSVIVGERVVVFVVYCVIN